MKPSVRYLLQVLFLFVATSGLVRAQAAAAGDGDAFPVPYGPTNLGKEFYFSFPTNYEDPGAAKQYIRLYITSPVRTRVQIYTGTILKRTIYTIPNDIVTMDLTKFEAQALSRSNTAEIPPDRIYRKKAVRVVADDPIVVYGMNRTDFTSDGMLILPVSALGSEYVVANARDVITGGRFIGYKLPSQFVIAAPFDGTVVSIETPWETPSRQRGEIYSITLDKGDVFSSMTVNPGGDMTGAWIWSSKPIAVTSGQNCTYLPDNRYQACDHIEEMMFPTSTWGRLYHSVPFATRLKGDMYRIFASGPETDIYINGVKKFTLNRKGGYEAYGWVEYLPPTRDHIEFSSNKPIMVAQYNNSLEYDGVKSDPFFMVLTPVEQYQTAFVFATPSPGDFAQNYVTVVADSAGYDKIEFARTGSEQWQNLAAYIPRAVKSFTTRRGDTTFVGVTFDLEAGAYKLRGPRPFAAYVYGFDLFDSYGYPLSAALSDLSSSDVDRPLVEKTQDCNGTVEAAVLDMPEDITIRSNLATIDLLPESVNYAIAVTEFEAGVAPGATYTLKVIDPRLDAIGIVQIYDKAGNSTRDTVVYTAFKVSADSLEYDLGDFFSGTSGRATITLTNHADQPVTITATSLRIGTQGFTIESPTDGFTLAPAGTAGATQDVVVRFDATDAGEFEDEIGLRDECGFRYVAKVRARVGTPIIQVSDWDFQTHPLAAPAKVYHITITNASTDGGTLIVSGIEKSFTTDGVIFSLPNGLPFTFPDTLAAGETTDLITVTFKPNAVRTYRDSIIFGHNAPPNPANDNIGDVMGEGIEGSLVATDVDWGRRRINTRAYDSTVTITNVGTSEMTLLANPQVTGDVAEFSIIDPAIVAGHRLGAGQSLDVPVRFTPLTTGQHQVIITWGHTPEQSEPVTSTLRGFGTQPALESENYYFGAMDITSTTDTVLDITFRIPPAGTPDVIDSVTITDFVMTGDLTDFTMDKPSLPVVLKRGKEQVTFRGHFKATAIGPRRVDVAAVTPDPVAAVSEWTGEGRVDDPLVEADPVSFDILCSGTRTLDAQIRNPGPVPLEIIDIQLTPDLEAVGFSIPARQFPIVIPPDGAIMLPVTFTPTSSGIFNGSLVVINNSVNHSPQLEIAISGASVSQSVDAAVVTRADGPGGQVELGKEFTAGVWTLDDINPAIPVTSYRVTLTYDGTQMEPVVAGLKPGAANNLATLSIASNTPGRLVIDVVSPMPIVARGELVSVPFKVFFHASGTRRVDALVEVPSVPCITVSTLSDSIGVVPICGLSVRLIEMTNTTYALRQNSPNPFNPVTTINYSLGLDGRTQILLHDTQGRLVQTLLDEYQQPGTYEATLDVTNLPSGMYFYTLVSGAWSETKMLTVTK